MITLEITIVCDDCKPIGKYTRFAAEPVDLDHLSITIVREHAQRRGWRFAGSKDICPDCAKPGLL